MSQLGSPAMDAFEEHLLVCSPCIDRVQGAREYIATVCAATVGRCH